MSAAAVNVEQREFVLETLIEMMERGFIPDFMVRAGIRKLCGDRLAAHNKLNADAKQTEEQRYLRDLRSSAVAVHTADANRQHYELPAEFFKIVLGRNLKYSCAFFNEGVTALDEAERAALDTTMARAEIEDGMSVLELGCGWGSLTIAMAKRFPKSKIVALSNSNSQRLFIENKAKESGLANVQVLTRDAAEVDGLGKEFGEFDRVVSVEMFEHLRNYEKLFARISSWLKPEGKLFVHIFTNKDHSYLFDTEGTNNWMGRYFFTGGQMPSRSLFAYFQKNLSLDNQWAWSGENYAKTSEAWLKNLDTNHAAVLEVMKKTYGEENAGRWLQRWRVFFLATSELFGFNHGAEWFVSHYLFSNKRST